MKAYLSGLSDDRYGLAGTYDLLRCGTCQLVRTWPPLGEREIQQIHAACYPRAGVEATALSAQLLDPTTVWGRFIIWLRGATNQTHLRARRGMRVLDYGCGTGTSLLELKHIGAEPYGIEIDPNVAPIAQRLGLRIHVGSLADEPFPGVSFDLITLNQVIEHITDPAALLAQLRRLLKPGGQVALSFPNVNSLYRRLWGRQWINWHVPFHTYHLSRRPFARLCQREHWTVVQWRTVTPNLWTLLQLQTLLRPPRPGVPSPLWAAPARGDGENQSRGPRSPALSWARAAWHALARLCAGAAVAGTNRLLDALRLGDSLVVVIEPAREEGAARSGGNRRSARS